MSEETIPKACRETRAALSAWVDGTLDRDTSDALARHLAGCPACTAERTLLQMVTRAVRKRDRPEPSADLQARLMARVRAEVARPNVQRARITHLGTRRQNMRVTLFRQESRPASVPSGVGSVRSIRFQKQTIGSMTTIRQVILYGEERR